ncbi:uncharacterized protein LOC110825670 isoform X2 [Carica papaya]|uniref:uncharacterized protein LOC110825670 isoform X2 n=1 Tax=Carica papaya TaxID=3649 RepID=UPI000B8C8821|nr:uncharacterized protein LOC110825670 isoform X2 [Carica papaya]
MVQLMVSTQKVKLEGQDFLEDQLGPLPKRSKLHSPIQQLNVERGEFVIPPSLYNPLDEPSPLGLRLKKTPSFLDLIQMKLSQKDATKLTNGGKKKDVSGGTDKLKASNFPAKALKIGTWEYKSRYEGDLVAKCYFAKHKIVWEMLDGSLKNKIEIQWSDIVGLNANYPDDEPGTLNITLARQPLFFRETNPQPRKHTLWQATSDFTGGQASINRQHFLQCSPGLLGKHFEKLIQCDPRLNFLSQQPEILLKSPYFEPGILALDGSHESCQEANLESEDRATVFELQDVLSLSLSVPQSSSPKAESAFGGRACEIFRQATPSPSSVMDTSAIEEIRSSGLKEPDWNGIKVPGLPPSVSMNDLMSHIGQCISEQMALANPNALSASDERLMSRVNSLCCLLHKDSAIENGLQGDDDSNSKLVETNTLSLSKNFPEDDGNSSMAFSQKQSAAILRKDSVGELLLNLPRIASLPQFLYGVSEQPS